MSSSMYDPSKPYKHEIIKLIQSTWQTPYVTVRPGIYPVITRKFSAKEVQHSDGIGTKGVYHLAKRTFKNAVIDAFAMNVNDLAMVGARPFTLQDHIVVPEAGEEAILEIVRALVALAKKYDVAVTGGETSHHNNVDAVDIGISMSGFIKDVRKNQAKPGDVLIGLPSNGLHANGFTLVRGMFGSEEWRDDFVEPTAIYLNPILKVLKRHTVNGMMHITGGAFTKLIDILGEADAHIAFPDSFTAKPIFTEIFNRGVTSERMYSTLNCGIGFVLSVPKEEAKRVRALLPKSIFIGHVTRGKGKVHILSAFDNSDIVFS